MDGYGVTNYNLNQPSYQYGTEKTEFQEALVQRGIVDDIQVLMSKGMKEDDAVRLLHESKQQVAAQHATNQQQQHDVVSNNGCKDVEHNDDDDDNDSFIDDEDDEFIQEYHQKRIQELKSSEQPPSVKASEDKNSVVIGHRTCYGEVVYITRSEWIREVNDASYFNTVIVCLTSSDVNRTGVIEETIKYYLSPKYSYTKFIFIPYQNAISSTYPIEHLPSLFIYNNGTMQHEMIKINPNYNKYDIEKLLHDLETLHEQ